MLSSQGAPGRFGPPGIPRQSGTRPAQVQSSWYTSLIVPGLPSSHIVPGSAGPSGSPSQSTGVPAHEQSFCITSSAVCASPSSQVDPGSGPPGHSSTQSGVPSLSASGKLLAAPGVEQVKMKSTLLLSVSTPSGNRAKLAPIPSPGSVPAPVPSVDDGMSPS